MENLKDCANGIMESGGKQTSLEKTLIDEGKFIPKHRFDCVNISLKEHKAQVIQLKVVNADLNKQNQSLICRLAETDRILNENRVLRELLTVMLNAQNSLKE